MKYLIMEMYMVTSDLFAKMLAIDLVVQMELQRQFNGVKYCWKAMI